MLQLPWKLMEILHLSHLIEVLQLVHEQVVFMHPWFWLKWFQLCFNVNLFDKTYITRIAVVAVATPKECPVVFQWSRSCLDSGFWFNKELRYPIDEQLNLYLRMSQLIVSFTLLLTCLDLEVESIRLPERHSPLQPKHFLPKWPSRRPRQVQVAMSPLPQVGRQEGPQLLYWPLLGETTLSNIHFFWWEEPISMNDLSSRVFIVGKPFGCPGNKRKVFIDLGKNLGLIEMFPQECRRYLMFPVGSKDAIFPYNKWLIEWRYLLNFGSTPHTKSVVNEGL